MKKGNKATLRNGDTFGLLQSKAWYRVNLADGVSSQDMSQTGTEQSSQVSNKNKQNFQDLLRASAETVTSSADTPESSSCVVNGKVQSNNDNPAVNIKVIVSI